MQVGMALTPNSLARRKPGVQIPSPPPQTLQVRASPASSRRRSLHVAAAPRPQPHVTVQPGRLSATRQLGPRPHTMTTQRGRRHLPADGRSSAHPASSGRPRDRSGHCSTTDHVEADPPLAQHDLRQPRAPGSNLGQTTRRRGHGGRPCRPPAIPAVRLPARLPRCTTSFRSDTADDGRHGHRTSTPDAEAEHWTPGRSDTRTGHRTPISWTGTRWTLSAPTGHRRGQGDDSTAGVRTSRALIAERPHAGDAQPCSCSRTTGQLLSRPAGQAAPRALLSSDDCGSSVERTAKLHPLWQEEAHGSRGLSGAERGEGSWR
jgi:hypothetical protein